MPSRRVVPHLGFAFLLPVAVATALSLGVLPAHAGLAVSEPAPLDPARIAAVRSQEGVAAAANDSVTLFAWTDARSGSGRDVYAARVRHDGTVLDPNGIPVAVTGADEAEPAVSWNGTNWLVAWKRNGGTVLSSRIAVDGEVLDPSGIFISASPFGFLAPAAAGLGGGHLIVWTESDIHSVLYGAIIGSDGSFEVAPVVLSLGGTPNDAAPAVAVNEPTALVAFQTNRNGNADIYGFRLERSTSGPPALVRVDAADFAISAGPDRETAPAVGARVDGWLVAWEDPRNAGAGIDVYAARVSAAGVVQDPAGTRLSDDAGNDRDVAVTHTGGEWLVAWSQADAGQFLRQVGNNGNPIGGRVDVSTASGTLGRAAFGGDPATPIVAWSAPETGTSAPTPPQDIVGAIVAAGPAPGAPFPISTQTPNQTQPALAFGGNRWFMAWVDDRYGPTEGRLRYAVTDSARFEQPSLVSFVAERPGLDQQQPTACFDGTNFNLFWTEERGGHRQVLGARFTTGGAPIDTFVVTSGAWSHLEPTATHVTSGTVVVAWTDERVVGNRDVWGIQVVGGAPVGAELALANAAGVQEERPQFAPRIVDPGYESTFLVYQKQTGPNTGSIAGRFVFIDPFGVSSYEETVRNEVGRVFEQPKIAWNGDSWLVTYQERVDNDGTGLYVPWGTWLAGGPYCFECGSVVLGPGSYVPANPIPMSSGFNFLTAWSRLAGPQVDLMIRRTSAVPGGFPDAAPIAYTNDAPVDVPGAGLKGQSDRMGFAYLRNQDDAEWQGLRLFGADARDTLVGAVLLNEFSAHPPSDRPEFYELFNTTGQDFQLKGWYIAVDGDSGRVALCDIGLRTPPLETQGAGGAPGDGTQGIVCGVLPDLDFFASSSFFGIAESPTEGFLPDRGAVIELFSPGGVKVDEVGYGFRGGAPVMPAIPAAIAPAARAGGGELAAAGDSVEVSTARLPNGGDTGNDANDFNSTTSPTAGTSNVGTAAQLGGSLFVTRLFWNPPAPGVDALELFNPGQSSVDFTNWYLGSNDGTERIGIQGSQFGVLESTEKRVLRRDEPGSFKTDLDYRTVVYLYTPEFVRVEQIGWSRADNQQPEQCMNREPETGGFHDGFDWFTSGGQQDLFSGELRYAQCSISSPDGSVDAGDPVASLSFRGAVPNPAVAGRGALVFSVPGARSGAAVPVRLRLVDVAGRARTTLVDGTMAPGEHRVPLGGRVALAAGVYYAELEIDGRRLSRPVVIVP